MTESRWIGEATILAIHDAPLAEHGGRPGLRDAGLLRSALTRPINRVAYTAADAFDRAASYAFGMARNHPFVDGNKRTAHVAAEWFLLKHGLELAAGDEDAVRSMLSLADDTVSEVEFAAWLRTNNIPFAAA